MLKKLLILPVAGLALWATGCGSASAPVAAESPTPAPKTQSVVANPAPVDLSYLDDFVANMDQVGSVFTETSEIMAICSDEACIQELYGLLSADLEDVMTEVAVNQADAERNDAPACLLEAMDDYADVLAIAHAGTVLGGEGDLDSANAMIREATPMMNAVGESIEACTPDA